MCSENCFCNKPFGLTRCDAKEVFTAAFRKKEKFPYELIPFGAEVTFKPESPRDMEKSNKFNPKAGLQGVMFGYKTEVGGKPTGDIYIFEREDLEKATSAAALYKGREIEIKQVITVQETHKDGKEYYRFPLATGEWKQPEASRVEKEIKSKVKLRRIKEGEPEPDWDLDTDLEEDEKRRKEATTNKPRNRDTRRPPDEKDSPNQTEQSSDGSNEDTWELNENFLTRHINTPRTKMFVLRQEDWSNST